MRAFIAALATSLALIAFHAASATPTASYKPGQTFRDCAGCPQMVALPAGRFLMGSPKSEPGRDPDGAEDPQHMVTIGYAFAVGRYEVTRDEWGLFVRETHLADPAGCNIHQAKGSSWPTIKGLNWHDTGFVQTGRHPAVCLSWTEAQAYLGWLSKRSGQRYRFLSEAEWEYAGRAGTTNAHYWGEKPADACAYANGSDQTRKDRFPEWNADQPCHDGYVFTAPVGSFKPNAFGLYDMMGNVAEMTADCVNESYNGAPTDGSPWLKGNCRMRINRGDTWTSTPGGLRSAARGADDINTTRVVDLGFRVARTL